MPSPLGVKVLLLFLVLIMMAPTGKSKKLLSGNREKRKVSNPAMYSICNQENSVCARLPGEVNGQQFRINNCKVCLLFSHVRILLYTYMISLTLLRLMGVLTALL